MILHHVDRGVGPVLLLLHSTAADAGMWNPQLDSWATRRRVIALDLRGFGSSPLPAEPFCHAADVVALLNDLRISTTAIVASSGGGHVALQVATAEPARISQLILLCAAADGVEPTPSLRARWDAERVFVDEGDLDAAARLNADCWLGPEADDAARRPVISMQRRALEIQVAAGEVEESDWPVDLAALTMPVLVVTGGHDLDFFGAVGRHLVAGLPRARSIELAWAGHLPNLERPDEITALVDEALLD